jgi:hypothetical protein
MAVSEAVGINRWRQAREYLLSVVVCVVSSYVFCSLAVPALAGGGIIRDFGFGPKPTDLLSPTDVAGMTWLASGLAGSLIGLLLCIAPRQSWVALFGTWVPWVGGAGYSLLGVQFNEVGYRYLLSSGGYLALAVGQWVVCWAAFSVLHYWRRTAR